jgi:hypothetical protein
MTQFNLADSPDKDPSSKENLRTAVHFRNREYLKVPDMQAVEPKLN